jgi:hypothetical protein
MVEFSRDEKPDFFITVFLREDWVLRHFHEKKRLRFPCPEFVPLNETTQKDSFIRVVRWHLDKIAILSPGIDRANEIIKQLNFISSHLEVLNRPVFKPFKKGVIERVRQFKAEDEKYFPKDFLNAFLKKVTYRRWRSRSV